MQRGIPNRSKASSRRSSSVVPTYSPDIHEHHGSETQDGVDDQLQDPRRPLGSARGLSGADTPQHQVVGGSAVPERHAAQNL